MPYLIFNEEGRPIDQYGREIHFGHGQETLLYWLKSSSTDARLNLSQRKDALNSAFCFTLATPADGAIFYTILKNLKEIDQLSGTDLVVFAPRIGAFDEQRERAERQFFDQIAALKVIDGEISNKDEVRQELLGFIDALRSDSYRLAEFLDLKKSTLPCLVFLDSLVHVDKYAVWPLRETKPSEFISGFRDIVAVIQQVKAKNTKTSIVHAIDAHVKNRRALRNVNKVVVVTLPKVLDVAAEVLGKAIGG